MINVSEATKQAWMSETTYKEYEVTVNNRRYIYNSSIKRDTINISASIMASSSVEFIGCISRKLEFTTDAFNGESLKNKSIKVRARAGETEWIPLFFGYVDEAKKDGMRGLKQIVAYDYLYRLSLTDITSWWNGLGVMTITRAFTRFCSQYDLPLGSYSFINGNEISYGGVLRTVKKLSGLEFLKHVCQINGCIGYIDGEGEFNTMYIDEDSGTGLYPADSLFPSDTIFPIDDGLDDEDVTIVPYYKSLLYEDFTIHQINKVTIQETSNEDGVYYPASGSNNYIIQGNIFTFGHSASDKYVMAHNIHRVVKNAIFRPFDGNQIAMPWIECGDKVNYYDIDDYGNQIVIQFIIMSRVLSGDQILWDKMSAEGEQDQHIFITNLQAQIDDLQNQINDESESPDIDYSSIVTAERVTIERPTVGGIEESISGIATEINDE